MSKVEGRGEDSDGVGSRAERAGAEGKGAERAGAGGSGEGGSGGERRILFCFYLVF